MSVGLVLDAATNVTETTALIQVVAFTTSGPSNAEYTFFWGTTDGGQVDGDWDNSQAIGAHADGEFGVTITGLDDHEVYYFSCKAVQTLPGPSTETSWPGSAPRSLFTLSYPQTACGSCVTLLNSPVAALAGRWSDGLCPPTIKSRFGASPTFGAQSVADMPGVTNSRVQLTTHITSLHTYTVPALTWTSNSPSRAYTPAPSGGQVQSDTGFGINVCPSAFNASALTYGDPWMLAKGAWKLEGSINVNAVFYNTNPLTGGVQGGPYAGRLKVYPYSTYQRPKRALPPTNYTLSIPASGYDFTQTFILRSDCFWFCQLEVDVWAGQANQGSPVTNVDIASVTLQATRA